MTCNACRRWQWRHRCTHGGSRSVGAHALLDQARDGAFVSRIGIDAALTMSGDLEPIAALQQDHRVNDQAVSRVTND